MRVITPEKRLLSFDKLTSYVEQAIQFNGGTTYLSQPIMDRNVQPNALSFENAGDIFELDSSNLFIGNLSKELYDEIMTSLLEKDYYDFSALKYQNKRNDQFICKTVKISPDELPYFMEEFFLPASGSQFTNVFSNKRGDDLDEEESGTSESEDPEEMEGC